MFPDNSFYKYDLAWYFLHTKSTFDMIAFSSVKCVVENWVSY